MKIKRNIYESILSCLGALPAEAGGILGAKDDIICEFYLDRQPPRNTEYVPDVATLNGQIATWSTRGIDFIGIVHSHPSEAPFLSAADMQYAELIFGGNSQMTRIAFPVVTLRDGTAHITNYVFDGTWQECALVPIP